MDKSNVESNMINLTEIKSLLEFVRFYNRLAKTYAILTMTWLRLIKERVRYKWQGYNSLVFYSVRENTIIN